MKCPYCKIHYMDDDRECPMCGTPNPERWSGKQRVNKKYKQSSKASADLKGKTHRSDKKSSTKIGAVASVAVVVISLIPTLISAVGDVVNDLDFTSSTFVEAEPAIPDNAPAIEDASPDYEVPASAYDTVQGEWVGLDEGGYLYLDLDGMDYSYAPNDQSEVEYGYAFIYEMDTFDNDDGTTQYDYQVDLYPNWDDYGYSMYLSASDSADSLLVTMKFDDQGYTDTDTMLLWARPGAQDM